MRKLCSVSLHTPMNINIKVENKIIEKQIWKSCRIAVSLKYDRMPTDCEQEAFV